MATSITPAREERAIADIHRLSLAGYERLDLLRRVVEVLKPVAPFDVFCATATDPVSNLITDAVSGPESVKLVKSGHAFAHYFDRVYFEHDFGDTVDMLRKGQSVRRLSDATRGDPARSGRYRLHLQPRGLGPEVYLTFTDRGLWGEMHLTREMGDPDFNDRELDVLRRITPQVGAGLKLAALRARATAVAQHEVAEAPGVLVVDRAGRVVSATANVPGFLRELGARDNRHAAGSDLPVAVQVVLASLDRSLGRETGKEHLQTPRLRVRRRSGRWLTLDASLTEPDGDGATGRVVIIGPAPSDEIAWLSMAAFQLSPREEKVVKLVVGGLSTRQIAARLSIAEHTVQRHFSNIFEKVGVRSRRDLVKRLFVEQVLPSLN